MAASNLNVNCVLLSVSLLASFMRLPVNTRNMAAIITRAWRCNHGHSRYRHYPSTVQICVNLSTVAVAPPTLSCPKDAAFELNPCSCTARGMPTNARGELSKNGGTLIALRAHCALAVRRALLGRARPRTLRR